MKTHLLLLFTTSLSIAYLNSAEKPNVLFIMSDDLSYNLGGQGHPIVKTPHLDEFSKSAVSFSKAYTQFPLCGPSRASIMTGQYAFKNGVVGNGGTIAPDRMTMPAYFKKNGYWSARISKIYHMGIPVDILEGTDGHDHKTSWNKKYNTPAMESMMPGKIIDYLNPDDPKVFPAEREKWKKAMKNGEPYNMVKEARSQFTVTIVKDKDVGLKADTMAADKAIDLLQKRSKDKKPFFLAVGFVRPHFPFIATESSISHYQIDNMDYPAFPENDFDDIPPQAINSKMEFSEHAIKALRRGYYGSITYMDQQFGRIMSELDRLKLRENTIIVFVSDHGYMIGEHSMHKKAKLWEEAIHVPLMISAPGIQGGSTCDEFVELIDLYPTITQLAKLPREEKCQGLSLVSLMKDPTSKRKEKPDALIQVSNGHGLRTDRWAFMWYPKKKKDPEAYMLFDMDKDPKQFNNLANNPEYADVMKKLSIRLKDRVKAALHN